MQAKDRLLKEIETLGSDNIMKVYDIVLSFKKQEGEITVRKKQDGYLRTRLALKNCRGSLSKDILDNRAERI